MTVNGEEPPYLGSDGIEQCPEGSRCATIEIEAIVSMGHLAGQSFVMSV